MDPNQNQPQQPVTPQPSQPPSPPLPPAQPTQPVPAQPAPQPVPMPPPAPVQTVAPIPQYPQPGQYTPQPQPQPMNYGGSDSSFNGGGKKRRFLKPVLASLAVLLILVVGYTIYAAMFAYKAEVQLGKDYITALQEKDYAKVEELIDPEFVKIADKVEDVAGSETKDSLYEQIVKADSKGIGTGEAKRKSVKVSGSGENKHAFVVYTVGSDTVTVLEIYDDSGNIYSLGAQSGTKDLSDEEFEQYYSEYKAKLKNYSAQIDTLASEAQDNESGQGLSSPVKSLDGLFQ